MFEKQLQEFFFKAMLVGWAGQSEKTDVEGMPGYKSIRYEDSDLLLVDTYCVTPRSNRSAGTTTIFLNGNPLWWMSYYGEYEKKAIPFLKQILKEAYEGQKFHGGRGPEGVHIYQDMKYTNELERKLFTDFAGMESICDRDGNPLGWHRYHGFGLV